MFDFKKRKVYLLEVKHDTKITKTKRFFIEHTVKNKEKEFEGCFIKYANFELPILILWVFPASGKVFVADSKFIKSESFSKTYKQGWSYNPGYYGIGHLVPANEMKKFGVLMDLYNLKDQLVTNTETEHWENKVIESLDKESLLTELLRFCLFNDSLTKEQVLCLFNSAIAYQDYSTFVPGDLEDFVSSLLPS